MSIDERMFRRTVGTFATGISVVTSINPDGGLPVGLTVNAFSSVSLDPPQVLVCLGRQSTSIEPIKAHGYFAVNILSSTQKDISIRFANKSDDKWGGVDYSPGLEGIPLLAGCIAHLQCSVVSTVVSGDHVIVIGEVVQADHNVSGAPLVYFRGAYIDNLMAHISAEDV